jgi:hypothetical protein
MRGARYVFLTIAVVGALRLGGELHRFAVESLQADFAAYYTAGESVREGLSPYDNGVDRHPPVWDGIAAYRHSRFLYPPLIAWLFIPLTAVPYAAAKVAWMVISLAAVLVAVVMAARGLGVGGSIPGMAFIASCTVLFFPLAVLMERGQIDGITLALLAGGALAHSSRQPRHLLGGILFACAAFIKPHLVILAPLLLYRRDVRGFAGFGAAMLLLLGISVAVHGMDPLTRYAVNEAPRIAAMGEEGNETDRIPPGLFREVNVGVPEGFATKGGGLYRRSTVEFAPNATLVRVVAGIPRQLHLPMSLAVVSVLLTVAGLVLYCRRFRDSLLAIPGTDTANEFTFWLGAFIVIMLCGPLTWTMNLVWLLPVTAVLVRMITVRGTDARGAGVLFLMGGLTLAALPEPGWIVFPDWWLRLKYPVAQFAILWGMTLPPAERKPGEVR